MELSTSTISNEIDKSLEEEFSVSQAAMYDAKLRKEKGQEPESISNEQIKKNDPILDTYKVLDDAIHGGMGSVWRVHHESWNVDLAMKRPQPRFFAEAGDGRKEEFIRECENWINLGLHPNIVSCYYVREIGGVPTIFSEWMDNGSLKDKIRDGSLFEGTEEEVQERILDIAIQTARGLKYSHENNLNHQDVKPGNILLTKDWDAKVADFGLAKAQSQLTENEKPVSTGYTIQYCPKEQAEGAPAEKWMDVYAWALIVLEMYAGKRLWETGAEAKERCEKYLSQCRIPLSPAMQELITDCLTDSVSDFQPIESILTDEYKDEFGYDYPRSATKAATDTPESLNNRALSYIDLGLYGQAEQMLKQAIEKDGSNFLYHYNYELLQWNRRKITDVEILAYLHNHSDKSELCRKTMDALSYIRNIRDFGKQEYWYLKRNERPGEVEPLLPPSTISFDGRYQVEGYSERISYGNELYGYRIKDTLTGEVRDFQNDFSYYGESTPRSGSYMHPHYYKSKTVRFVGARSEIVVMDADVLWFFDAKTGRVILTLPPVVDEDGDSWGYNTLGYTESGVIEYFNEDYHNHEVKGIRLPTGDNLSYELAGITTVDARLEAEQSVIKNYERALTCWEKNDIVGTYQALNQSMEDQVLALHEPSLQLWTKLSSYYKRGSLVTVVPTEDEPTPVPRRSECLTNQQFSMSEKNRNHTENGQTCLELNRTEEEEYDTCNDMFEYTFYYTLTATDILSQEKYYTVRYLEVACEADWKQFSKDRYLGLEGDHLLRYVAEYGEDQTIDLAEMSVKNSDCVFFSLPGPYTLKNTSNGVDIGGFIFQDVFTDFRPLWTSDVISCRDHNYRLVYKYGEMREDVVVPANTDEAEKENDKKKITSEESVSLEPEDTSSHSFSPDGSQDDSPETVVEEAKGQIKKGDVLLRDYEVLTDATYGGMGKVWHVHQRSKNRDLAMKQPQLRGTEERQNRQKEYFIKAHQNWIELGQHPDIVTCYEVTDVDGIPTSFSEWMEGGSLREKISDGSLYADKGFWLRALRTAIRIARGLEYAHSKNVIHCDIKPANVLFTADGTAKINDFSLALFQNSDGCAPSGYTPQYCSKEQQEGQAVDRKTDIYSCALTVMEMFIGSRPWSTGPEVAEQPERYFAQSRIPIPDEMKDLLTRCLRGEVTDATTLRAELENMPINPHYSSPAVEEKTIIVNKNDLPEPLEEKSGTKAKDSFWSKIRKKMGICRKEDDHEWDGCKCSICGAERHDFEKINVEVVEPDCCKWSSGDPCTGPNCGTWCDSYYPGREGKTITTWKCKRCGSTKTEEKEGN